MDKHASSWLAEVCTHAVAAQPDEACGVLLGDGASDVVYQALRGRNVAADTATQFVLDAATLLQADDFARTYGWQIVGFYHSHPHSAPVPSPSDRAAAWPGLMQVIVGVRAGTVYVCAWRIVARQITPILYPRLKA